MEFKQIDPCPRPFQLSTSHQKGEKTQTPIQVVHVIHHPASRGSWRYGDCWGGAADIFAPVGFLLSELHALFLLSDQARDWAGDAADQGPVLVKTDLPVMVLIQVTDQFVGCLLVLGVLRVERGGKALMRSKNSNHLPEEHQKPCVVLHKECMLVDPLA